MLGLANVENETIQPSPSLRDAKELPRAFSQHIADKFRKNRLAHYILEAVTTKGSLTLNEAATLLKEKCPYISAAPKTWEMYADVFCGWLEAGGLLRYQKKVLSKAPSAQNPTEIIFSPTRKRGGVQAFQVHYSPVYKTILALIDFFKTKQMAWPPMKPSTRDKCLTILEDFGFLVRTDDQLRLSSEFTKIIGATSPEIIIAEAAMKIRSFSTFVQILEAHKTTKCEILVLGKELRTKVDADWSDGTARTAAKIALDWARHLKLAPGVFSARYKTRRKPTASLQPDLFTEHSEA